MNESLASGLSVYARFGSLLFWLLLALPGYAVVRRFFRDELRSGLLGTLGLSYLASFALLSPVSIGCYVFRAPLWVFSSFFLLAVIGGLIEITRQGWWRETGRLIIGGASVELSIVALDMILGARTGAITEGDAVVHLTRIRDVLDQGFSNLNPFVAEPFFFPIYHTNILHALYAACTQLTGVHHLSVWYASLPWGKLLIAGGAYYLTWSIYDRRWVAWVAAVFTVGCYGPVTFMVYPNKLAPYWILALMIAFVVQACQSPCHWKSMLKIGAASLVVGQIHSLYGGFAAVALAPVLLAVCAERMLRRKPDRWRVAACILGLAMAMPFVVVSKVKMGGAPSVSTGQEVAASESERPNTKEEGRITMGPRAGWGTVRDPRALFLAAGVIAALAGSRRKQAAVLFAVAGTVALIFYVPPLCTAAVDFLHEKWILGRMGAVLKLAFIGLVPASFAFLLEPRASHWAVGFIVGLVTLFVLWSSGHTGAVYVGIPCLLVGSTLSLWVESTRAWWTRSVASVLVLTLALPFLPKRNPVYTWANYCRTATAPKEERESYLIQTSQITAFLAKHLPRGETVLLEEWPGMVLTMVHDGHIVAPKLAGAGITDLSQRRRDLRRMLAPNTPWQRRRSLLHKYGITFFMPARTSAAWTQPHQETLIDEDGLRLYVLNTDDEE